VLKCGSERTLLLLVVTNDVLEPNQFQRFPELLQLRGKSCSYGMQSVHVVCPLRRGPSFTDVNTVGLHPPSASVALDKNYIKFSATKQWRVTPLKGIWQHPPYFHDGSGAFDTTTAKCRDGSDIGSLAGASDRVRQDLACVVNRYNDSRELNLGLTDTQRADLVEYLKSL